MNGGEWGTADSVPAETYTFTLDIAQPEPAQLESLIIHTGTTLTDSSVLLKNSTDAYATANVFSPDTYQYTLATLSDSLTQLRFQAKPADDGATVTIEYYNGSKDITWTSDSSKWANCLTGGRNTLRITVTPARGVRKKRDDVYGRSRLCAGDDRAERRHGRDAAVSR
jgi:hypothetical protein